MNKELLRTVPLKDVQIHDRFWNHYIDLVGEVILPFMWELINDRVEGAEKSWCIQNLKIAAGQMSGVHQGAVFQDTDVAKWLEAVGFYLTRHVDEKLEHLADEAIDLICAAQCDDGYLNTYVQLIGAPRWKNLMEGHELYTAGHLIEAAVAYYEGTGKRKFLDAMCRFADCIAETFGPEDNKLHGYPGHPEIELALMKLYRITGEERYLRLAEFFIRERGSQPSYFDQEDCRRKGAHLFPEFAEFDLDYCQADRPLEEQTEAEGHAVRAGYLYSAMADLAAQLRDERMMQQCETLWKDIVEKKLYVTGSIGSASFGERFTGPYDLPNDTNYSESCASISLAMFSNRMLHANRRAEYADVVENALYNTVLAGIALDGRHFFYVNPLEVNPAVAETNPTMRHIKTERQLWYGVACCPPNIARTLASMGNYIYAQDDESLYVNLYIQSQVKVQLGGRDVTLSLKADYPASGSVQLCVEDIRGADEGEFTLAMRIPGYAPDASCCINGEAVADLHDYITDGYLTLHRTWKSGDVITLVLDNAFRFVYANPQVASDVGKTALMKGPFVYCFEEADNGAHLAAGMLNTEEAPEDCVLSELPEGVLAAKVKGEKAEINAQALYTTAKPRYESKDYIAIPYCLWNNRGKGEMSVWMRYV